MEAAHPQARLWTLPRFLWLASLLVGSSTALGQTLMVFPSKDNTLYETTGTQLSNGQGIYMFTGLTGTGEARRALVAFDLSAIPSNATITSVSLSLFLTRPRSDLSAETITLHKVLKNWGEGASNAGDPGGGGTTAQAGDATWLYNSFNTSFWTTPGGDFAAAISASTSVSTNNRAYTWSGSGMVADVQSWIADPASNFGWLIAGNEGSGQTAQRFLTGESASNRPQLTVTYTVSGGTPTPTPTTTPTPTPTASPTPSPTPTATASPTPTATPSPTPTATPSPSSSQLLNISTRLRVETGDDALIGGFIITGNASKKLIIRAIGPSLTQFGLTDLLANPVLQLRGPNGSLMTSNDNWRENQETDIQNSGVAPTNDLESAIIAMLPPANYTAIVRGIEDTTGVGVVELYDLDQTVDALLANISTRGLVQTGNNVMIGGFIIGGGNASAKVILRAIGPSLSQQGVANPLGDPTLRLFDGNGTLLAENDDWEDDPVQAAEIIAAGIPPQNDLESALVATLPPGPSTGIVAGKGGAIGVALVEAYHLR